MAAEAGLKPYDLAALYPIVVEAGGRFSGIAGTGTVWEGTALATNGLLHDRAAAILTGDQRA